jgi:DNA mismatch repair protein MutH
LEPARNTRLVHRVLGRNLLLSYQQEWIRERRDWEEFLEGIVSGGGDENIRVQGGESISPQERVLAVKEKNRKYQALLHKIDRMRDILSTLTEDQYEVVDLMLWQGLPWHTVAGMVCYSRGRLYQVLHSVEEGVGRTWLGEEGP